MTMARIFSRLCSTVAIVALSACGPGVNSASPRSAAAAFPKVSPAFTVLYAFTGGPADGKLPQGVSQGPGGSLFGNTLEGGHIRPRDCKSTGCGTLYRYNDSAEQILYLFRGRPRGFHPTGGLILRDGVFYGVSQGGRYHQGLVFSMSRNASGAWVVSTLYNFKGPPDGSGPTGVGYVGPRGNLYGTSQMGGSGTACGFESLGCGTVFELEPPAKPGGSWKESILHSFVGGPSDGASPNEVLIRHRDLLYGTTEFGGASTQCRYAYGCGTIFKLALDGIATERTEYSFSATSSIDGILPGTIVDGGDGNIYGITQYGGGGGGGSGCAFTRGPVGCGTVYQFPFAHGSKTRDTILYAFAGSPDGLLPNSISGNARLGFFGLTSYGGSTACVTQFGCGTIFAIDRSGSGWKETIVHEFIGSDGAYPRGPIVISGSQLYGTAAFGGPQPCECGTLYELTLGSQAGLVMTVK